MDPRQFLDTAGDLLKGQKREGDLRSCVSRAYYAVFHLVLAGVVSKVEPSLREQAGLGKNPNHTPLSRCLKSCGEPAVEKIGVQLENLYCKRRLSDYQMQKTVGLRNAEQALQDAEVLWSEMSVLGAERLGTVVREVLLKRHGS